MARFLTERDHYPTVQQLSSRAKRRLWVASPYLGSQARYILSRRIFDLPFRNIRFIFGLNRLSVEKGEVYPFEIAYLQSHFPSKKIRRNNSFHSKIYIFDDSALVTSANFSRRAFERNVEAGVLLEGEQAKPVVRFYEKLWKDSQPIDSIKKYEDIWSVTRPNEKRGGLGVYGTGGKQHTKIKLWDEEPWIILTERQVSAETERMISEETHWKGPAICGLRPNAFQKMTCSQIVFHIFNFFGKTGSLEMGIVKDKLPVRTDEGRYHLTYERVRGTKKVLLNNHIRNRIRNLLPQLRRKIWLQRKLAGCQAYELEKIVRGR